MMTTVPEIQGTLNKHLLKKRMTSYLCGYEIYVILYKIITHCPFHHVTHKMLPPKPPTHD